MNKKLYIETWGCQMNDYDSKRIGELLKASLDLKIVQNYEDADILLMNTCSIREKAQEKVFSRLGQWRPLKEKNPNIIIGVGGCVASQEGKAIKTRAPFVDIIFGPQTLHRLPTLIKEAKKERKLAIDISFPQIEKFDNLPDQESDGVTGSCTIQEGCSRYCTYCIVPYTRGFEVNRSLDDIIYEVANLANQGVREITLLGQNVNAYRGTMQNGETADLGILIKYIAQIKGIDRIRFTTSHPNEFSQTLINAYDEVPELANHLHLPVQSGSNRILSLMGRNHTASEYKAKIKKLRNFRPDISISSDFIVGFPGETDEDFAKTMDLVKDIEFDNSFSFMFSPRPGTPASGLPNQISIEIKKKRLEILQNQLKLQAQNFSNKMLHSKQKILVSNVSKKSSDFLCGRTENNRVVNFKSNKKNLIGQFVDIHITKVLPNCLIGELLHN